MNRLLAILILGLLSACASTPRSRRSTTSRRRRSSRLPSARRRCRAAGRCSPARPNATTSPSSAEPVRRSCPPSSPSPRASTRSPATARASASRTDRSCARASRSGAAAMPTRSATPDRVSAPSAPTTSITCSSGDDLHRRPGEASDHRDRRPHPRSIVQWHGRGFCGSLRDDGVERRVEVRDDLAGLVCPHGSEAEDPGQRALSAERGSDGIGRSSVLGTMMHRLGLEKISLDPDRIAPGHAVFLHGVFTCWNDRTIGHRDDSPMTPRRVASPFIRMPCIAPMHKISAEARLRR